MVKVRYTRKQGLKLTYDIEANTSGSYLIRLDGKVLRNQSDPLVVLGIDPPSEERQAEALRRAKADIELLMGIREV